MEETLQICTAFMFADDIPAAGISSRLLLMYGCEENRCCVVAEVLTITNMVTREISGVKKKKGVSRGMKEGEQKFAVFNVIRYNRAYA